MKRMVCTLLAAASLLGAVSQAAPAPGRGGVVGFFVGCCFGLRNGLAWNEGKDLHFRDWGPIIPFVGIVVSIWNGIETMNGATNKDLAAMYPGNFY